MALVTKLVNTVYFAGFIIFISGIRELIRSRGAEYEWAAMLALVGGLASWIVILVGDLLGAAAALDTYSAPDPVVIRALTEATKPAFGAIGLTMTVFFLAAASWGILATRTLPRWTGWMGYAVAVLTLVAAGTIFGGNDFLNTTIWGGSASAGFYSYSYSMAGLAWKSGRRRLHVPGGASQSRRPVDRLLIPFLSRRSRAAVSTPRAGEEGQDPARVELWVVVSASVCFARGTTHTSTGGWSRLPSTGGRSRRGSGYQPCRGSAARACTGPISISRYIVLPLNTGHSGRCDVSVHFDPKRVSVRGRGYESAIRSADHRRVE